jgi:mRNA interferase MazF
VDLSLLPGEVFFARPDPAVGREQAGRRPVVVVSNELFHDAVTTLALVVPVTSVDRRWDNHIRLAGSHGLDAMSFAMTEQVRVVSRARLDRRLGAVDSATLEAIREWVRDYLR